MSTTILSLKRWPSRCWSSTIGKLPRGGKLTTIPAVSHSASLTKHFSSNPSARGVFCGHVCDKSRTARIQSIFDALIKHCEPLGQSSDPLALAPPSAPQNAKDGDWFHGLVPVRRRLTAVPLVPKGLHSCSNFRAPFLSNHLVSRKPEYSQNIQCDSRSQSY